MYGDQDAAAVDWFAIAQQLIGAGHDRAQLARYTLRELLGYLRTIGEQAELQAQRQALNTAVALSVKP